MDGKKIKIRIDAERCKGCMFCVKVCPKKVLDKGGKVNERGVQCVIVKAPEECIGCGLCAIMCPDSAIEISSG
ncbi:MAG: ferredoxin family protein [Candidatus Omnitrophica bacterium]|nr:ferredoxin family protein [Candidatus Omnitrophota bacterium]